ncbi:PH domain-containing protein [Cellulosimicrobium marinum]|uniref:PH domain-containing protein n=1 Tax=Cellulosimicrobium marinum TaxID=1638992 RepID=UPI001E55E380|nr:PH domain-containing protein [Cellulosimicrobium marinum]MCB7137911.1 PH domain-containing protein [Cellulosimicrobium marinum]
MPQGGRPRSRVIDRYVLTGERVVVATRHHWAMLLEPVATTTAGLFVVSWLVVQAGPSVGDGILVVWWLWLILAARLAWKVLEWRNEWFVATDKRLLLLYGLITHKVAMMPLTKVTDLNYGRSVVGRALGYGQFVLESAGQDQALRQVDWVGHPEATYRRICDTLFGPGGSAGRPGAKPAAPAPSVVPPPQPTAAPRSPGWPRRRPGHAGDGADEPRTVLPAPAWDGHSPVPATPSAPAAPPVPAPPRRDEPIVVTGRAEVLRDGPASGPTQPLPLDGAGRGRTPAHDTDGQGVPEDDEPGWAVSGEHRATYVPVVHPRPTSPPVPRPYEPGPGRPPAP